jgi:hypothetical protein
MNNINAVVYNIDKPTKPIIKNSKLFIFDTLDNAMDFSTDFIVKVKAKNVTTTKCIVNMCNINDMQTVKAFWSDGLYDRIDKGTKLKVPIIGTLLCDELEIVQPVFIAEYISSYLRYHKKIYNWVQEFQIK